MLKVLIIDDSELMRKQIHNQLMDVGRSLLLEEATDGHKGIEIVRTFDPDLVILDLHLPDMNGIEVLKEIRKTDKEIKICVLTNYPYPQYRKKSIEFGADHFLYKSEDFEKLAWVINGAGEGKSGPTSKDLIS
ncbi:MAG TPA: response regulator transcription factor [Bacteroidales bacterium]|nr:response regulator transcription factor [Bacteroidales bacterium]HPS62871.1 response regulator transcription factor [Bacteroidales bacterium]